MIREGNASAGLFSLNKSIAFWVNKYQTIFYLYKHYCCYARFLVETTQAYTLHTLTHTYTESYPEHSCVDGLEAFTRP